MTRLAFYATAVGWRDGGLLLGHGHLPRVDVLLLCCIGLLASTQRPGRPFAGLWPGAPRTKRHTCAFTALPWALLLVLVLLLLSAAAGLACPPPTTPTRQTAAADDAGAERWACAAGRLENPVVVRAGGRRERDKNTDWIRRGRPLIGQACIKPRPQPLKEKAGEAKHEVAAAAFRGGPALPRETE